jgi:hypothetical protein
MMNKKGSGLGIAIIVSVMFFLIGMTALNYLTPEVTRTVAADSLNCANAADISDGNKLLCLAVDMVVPYFILLVVSTAGGYITAKFIL